MPELIQGQLENYNKARRQQGAYDVKVTPYGALHVDPFYGRLFKTLTPSAAFNGRSEPVGVVWK